ncbi:alanine racemase [Roseospirillum parvum]|uniref:Alanine racemase n=1 Tax=Roseospirillum parvum TaxID=83401 RepID=A0A1G8AZE3_9PROT|nr:alanine racemase [Roseospirillum parvum]SDH26372.1 alanine racemase [Roseospirillum parvum]
MSPFAGSDPAANALLTIDLGALVANWRTLAGQLAGGGQCAAVVKADAYGTGAARVGPALAAAGCRVFFVAQLAEAEALKPLLPEGCEVWVLGGPLPGTVERFLAAGVAPVLNTPWQIALWRDEAPPGSPCALHVDTGMSRLGLEPAELEALLADASAPLAALAPRHLISHLVSAEDPAASVNRAQLELFDRLLAATRRVVPDIAGCLANSSGIFLGPKAHHALARPGVALYGANPTPDQPNPMRPVVRLDAKILQVRHVDAPRTVGYGATHRVAGPTRLATVGVGYADGYPRVLSSRAHGLVAGQVVPLVGRVSMDLATFDVTGVPAEALVPGAPLTLLGGQDADGVAVPETSLDHVAEQAGTIAYEILTSLGRRYARRYIDP